MPERLEREANFTVEEFLCPQHIFLFFSRVACKRRDTTESDDKAVEFARKQAAVHSDGMEALRQKSLIPCCSLERTCA